MATRREFIKSSTSSILAAAFFPLPLALEKNTQPLPQGENDGSDLTSSLHQLEIWEAPSEGRFDFPRPRYPKNIPKIRSVEPLMPMARHRASLPPDLQQSHLPGYAVDAGEKVLFIVPSNYDPLVWQAITAALRERGALVNNVILDIAQDRERGVQRDGTTGPGELEDEPILTSLTRRRPRPEGKPWFIDLARQLGHRLVIEGSGGPLVSVTQGIRDFVHQHIEWPTRENFFLRASIPYQLRLAIDRAAMAPLLEGGKVRITDPEGTDVTFTIRPRLWSIVAERERRPKVQVGHLWGTPQMVIVPESDAQGVIAGSANHVGFYPRIQVHLEKQKVVKIEWGGRYGDIWREIEEKAKNIQWPEYPRTGFSWLIEAGIGTEPSCVPGWCWNTGEIRHSGVIHFGFGVGSQTERFKNFIEKTGYPGGHIHIHNRLPTYDITDSRGETKRVIDKGRLTSLDDPEVRKEAAKYGDPDLLLRDLWVPALPGINYPGNYERDYAGDPVAWMRKWKTILEANVDRVLLYGERLPRAPIWEI